MSLADSSTSPSYHSLVQEAYKYTAGPMQLSEEPSTRPELSEARHKTIEPRVDGIHPTTPANARPESDSSPKWHSAEKSAVVGVIPQSESSGALESTGWAPSLLRAGPLVGIAALAFGVLQVVASYAVLKASDGDAVPNWRYQPTVYLAILTAISNKALAFAMIQGAVVTFWLRALRGTTLAYVYLSATRYCI